MPVVDTLNLFAATDAVWAGAMGRGLIPNREPIFYYVTNYSTASPPPTNEGDRYRGLSMEQGLALMNKQHGLFMGDVE